MLPPLVKLKTDRKAAKALGITHLDDSILYISSEEDMLFIIQAADAFLKND